MFTMHFPVVFDFVNFTAEDALFLIVIVVAILVSTFSFISLKQKNLSSIIKEEVEENESKIYK